MDLAVRLLEEVQQKGQQSSSRYVCLTTLLQPWLLRSKLPRGEASNASALSKWCHKRVQTTRYKFTDALVDFCYLPQLNAFRREANPAPSLISIVYHCCSQAVLQTGDPSSAAGA